MQSLALSKHHYLVKPSFSMPLAVLGQWGGGVGGGWAMIMEILMTSTFTSLRFGVPRYRMGYATILLFPRMA